MEVALSVTLAGSGAAPDSVVVTRTRDVLTVDTVTESPPVVAVVPAARKGPPFSEKRQLAGPLASNSIDWPTWMLTVADSPPRTGCPKLRPSRKPLTENATPLPLPLPAT